MTPTRCVGPKPGQQVEDPGGGPEFVSTSGPIFIVTPRWGRPLEQPVRGVSVDIGL